MERERERGKCIIINERARERGRRKKEWGMELINMVVNTTLFDSLVMTG